jgi:glycosyltransferase involved in cell wall biosynthesis
LRILLIAYYFPPLGMGGTQRLAKWCKYLKRRGATPTVITVKPIAYYARDESLLSDVKGVHIIRTESLDPGRVLFHLQKKSASATQAKRRRWMSWFFVPDSRVLWLPFALWHAVRLLRTEKQDAVITSGPPHSSHFMGWILKKLFGVIWLADFRDSWSGGDFQPEPTPLHRRLNLAMQRFILQRADVLSAISQRLAVELKSQSGCGQLNLHVVSNGYDPDDFSARVDADKSFTVVFCGAITDITDPQTLIEGFRAFVEMSQCAPDEARLRFVGADLTGKVAECVGENNLTEYVDLPAYVSHTEAILAIRRAAVLVYIAAPDTSDVYIGGKTYEYLAARRPLLCIGKRVDGMNILQDHAPARACDFRDIDAIARALSAFYREFFDGRLPATPGADLPAFSRSAQAGRVLSLLIDAAAFRDTK